MATRERRRLFVVGGVIALAVAGAALYWFAPWNLVVDRRVDEAPPSVAAPNATTDETTPTGETTADRDDADDGGEGRAELSSGRFRSLEHETTGAAVVIELEDGSRFVRLDDLETSNGPDLRVILSSEAPQEDWYVYDDGEHVDLGALKGNIGSSNYEVPDGLDLADFESIVVWCRRFSVGFGVAPLALAS